MEINGRIKQLYQSLGLSQKDFCRNIGVSESTISTIISGKVAPSWSVIQKIVAAYPNLNSEWLLKEHGPIFLNGDGVEEPRAKYITSKNMDYLELVQDVEDMKRRIRIIEQQIKKL